MFEDELAKVEESFRGLGQIRERAAAQAGRADEQTLTRMLQATERLRRAADALELTLLGHASRFGEEVGEDHVYRPVRLPEGEVAEFAVDALGLALGAGAGEAGRRCDLSARAITDLRRLADLVAAGRMRERSLEVVGKETREAGPDAVAAVVGHLLDPLRGRPGSTRATDLDERELRKATRRILQRVEPELLADRARRNRRNALYVAFSEGPVGCTDLHATLPAETALALKEAIDAVAKQLRQADPTLTAGASRAQGLADLALRGVEVTPHVRLGLPIITSAASRLSFAPYAGGEGRPAAGDAAHALHGPTAVEGRFVTGEGPDAVDVVPEEWAGNAITAQVAAGPGPDGQRTWVSGCDIPGVGFIPADVVAALTTHLDTTVSRALVDARTGVLVETSDPRYVVPRAMRDFVTTRDGTCRMWGCTRRVARGAEQAADLDHALPYPQGATSPANLSGLCRHHHRVKHSPRWTHTLHEDGRAEWTSPAGVPASTFPAHWVHSLDEGEVPVSAWAAGEPTLGPDDGGQLVVAPASPPVEGAKEGGEELVAPAVECGPVPF